MKLEGLAVLLQVEVGVADLTVDGAQSLQLRRTYLYGGLEELDSRATVARLTEAFAFQRHVKARALHRCRLKPIDVQTALLIFSQIFILDSF